MMIEQPDPLNHTALRWDRSRSLTRYMVGLGAAISITLVEAAAQPGAGQRAYDQVVTDIRITPDHACTMPQSAIEGWLPTVVNGAGLMNDIGRTVFREGSSVAPRDGSYDSILRKTQEDSQRREADAKAIYRARETGGEKPISSQPTASKPTYRTGLYDIKAISRIPNGVNCSATAWVGALRFTVTYNVTADASQADGWVSTPRVPSFTVEAALSSNPEIRVHYGENDLTLAEARLQSRRDLVSEQAASNTRKREADAQTAYRNSPGGRVAALRQRQAAARKQQACEANGGTWGIPVGSTIVQVDALTSNDLQLMNEACYFLGK